MYMAVKEARGSIFLLASRVRAPNSDLLIQKLNVFAPSERELTHFKSSKHELPHMSAPCIRQLTVHLQGLRSRPSGRRRRLSLRRWVSSKNEAFQHTLFLRY
eukprot:gnl/TRDRNA2_/TRDRNA2_96390_c1_seq1.p1 gnl/TRDRNA2_/TRDRNA2_96390_c1~~gnl/TRDRNA2_/TRDRNA2_96390_c1_seq1.p1  ORF type:complete len:102 (+),score=4.93 gnl/TRDRNA2_/TRDRNA2_96390_c1_seq1:152-457(+)